MIIFHSVSPAKELSNTNEKKSSNGLSPPSESNEIFRFYNAHMLTITLLVIETFPTPTSLLKFKTKKVEKYSI